MTVLEAKATYGTKSTMTNRGDTLSSVVRRLYGTDDSKGYLVLKTLNLRFDWACLEPGQELQYLSKEILQKVSEV